MLEEDVWGILNLGPCSFSRDPLSGSMLIGGRVIPFQDMGNIEALSEWYNFRREKQRKPMNNGKRNLSFDQLLRAPDCLLAKGHFASTARPLPTGNDWSQTPPWQTATEFRGRSSARYVAMGDIEGLGLACRQGIRKSASYTAKSI